jgi:hypothetical protein
MSAQEARTARYDCICATSASRLGTSVRHASLKQASAGRGRSAVASARGETWRNSSGGMRSSHHSGWDGWVSSRRWGRRGWRRINYGAAPRPRSDGHRGFFLSSNGGRQCWDFFSQQEERQSVKKKSLPPPPNLFPFL